MITIEAAKALARRTLSQRRYEHTLNVRRLAVRLAKIHHVDVEKAALAALLHDIAKEMPKDQMLQLFSENAIISGNIAQRLFPVWHGHAAAILARTQYGVDDEEILSAIRCHTTGRSGMTPLDKVIYLADMASEERSYPEAEQLRARAEKNLDAAVLDGLGMTIAWNKQQGKQLDPETLEAYAFERARMLARK